MPQTDLTTDELSGRIKYDTRTIRERLKDSVLLEGGHYDPRRAHQALILQGFYLM
jgi:hypothetical protein